MRKVLLSVGRDPRLAALRNTVLARAKHCIIPAGNAADALQVIETRRLDAVIVGHSLAATDRLSILRAAKSRHIPTILLHSSPYAEPFAGADANLCGLDGADRILQVLSTLW